MIPEILKGTTEITHGTGLSIRYCIIGSHSLYNIRLLRFYHIQCHKVKHRSFFHIKNKITIKHFLRLQLHIKDDPRQNNNNRTEAIMHIVFCCRYRAGEIKVTQWLTSAGRTAKTRDSHPKRSDGRLKWNFWKMVSRWRRWRRRQGGGNRVPLMNGEPSVSHVIVAGTKWIRSFGSSIFFQPGAKYEIGAFLSDAEYEL